MSEQVLVHHCPWCSRRHDRVRNVVSSDHCQAGDVTICINCGSPGIFTAALELRRPTKVEMAELAADPRYCAVVASWQEIMRRTLQ